MLISIARKGVYRTYGLFVSLYIEIKCIDIL